MGSFAGKLLQVAVIAASLVSGPLGLGIYTALAVAVAVTAYSSYAAAKAKRAARDAFNAGLNDRLVMSALVDEARSKVYGRVRNVEGIVFKATHGANSEIYTLLVAVAGHEIDFVEQIYFDDLPITVDSNGYVLSAPYFSTTLVSATETFTSAEGNWGVYLQHVPVTATATYQFTSDSIEGGSNSFEVPLTIAGNYVSGVLNSQGQSQTGIGVVTVQYQWNNGVSKARVRPYLGNSRPDLLAGLMADIPGAGLIATDRFDGMALLRVDLTYDTDVFPSGVPSVSAVIRGARVYDPRNGLTVWSENPALCARDWALYKYGGAITSDIVDDASFTAAANACDVSTTFPVGRVGYTVAGGYAPGAIFIATATGVGAIPAGWHLNFAGDATTYLVTAGTTMGGDALTISPGLAQALPNGTVITAFAYLKQAPLFTCGTVAKTDQDPWVTFNEIVESMAGKAGWPGGKLRVRAGAYIAPVASITEDWLSGVDSIQIIPEPPTDEAVNIYTPTIANGVPTSAGTGSGYVIASGVAAGAVTIPLTAGTGTIPLGEYVRFATDPNAYLLDNGVTATGQSLTLTAPGLKQAIAPGATVTLLGDLKTAYVAAPAPDVRADAYVTLDGRELKQDTTLSAVTDVWHAQHVCGVMLRDARNGLTVTLPCNLRAFQLELFDVVTVTLSRFGWTAKTFEVLGWQFSLSGGVTLTLKETAASIYQVDAGFSLIDQTPNTNLPDPFTVPVITGLAASSGTNQLLVQGDGTIITRILATWDAVADQAVISSTRGGIVIRYWLASDDESLAAQVVLPGDATQTYLTGVQDGTFYMISAQARNSLVAGLESPPIIHRVIGKTEPPPDVSTFSVLEQPDGRRIYTWTMDSPPLDLGGFRIRYSNLEDGTPWESMIPLAEPGALARTLELYEPRDGEYTIAIKAVDTTGNESVNALFIDVLLDSTSIGALIYLLRAHERGWPGVKDGCYVDGYSLLANSVETWDTIGGVALLSPILDGSGALILDGSGSVIAMDSGSSGDTWDAWIGTWFGTSDTPIFYTEEVIDLGSVQTVHLRESSQASSTAVSSYSSSTNGTDWTPYAPVPGGSVSLQYVRIRWGVAGTNPSLQRAQLSIYA